MVQSEALWARIPEIQVRIPSRAMGTFFPHTVSSIFCLSLTHSCTHTHTPHSNHHPEEVKKIVKVSFSCRKKCPLPSANKRFINNTVLSTLRSRRDHSSQGMILRLLCFFDVIWRGHWQFVCKLFKCTGEIEK